MISKTAWPECPKDEVRYWAQRATRLLVIVIIAINITLQADPWCPTSLGDQLLHHHRHRHHVQPRHPRPLPQQQGHHNGGGDDDDDNPCNLPSMIRCRIR